MNTNNDIEDNIIKASHGVKRFADFETFIVTFTTKGGILWTRLFGLTWGLTEARK
jgi:hypothetical protein